VLSRLQKVIYAVNGVDSAAVADEANERVDCLDQKKCY